MNRLNPRNVGSSFGKKRKPWHVEAAIKDLHRQMIEHRQQWLDAYFTIHAPPNVVALLLKRDTKGLEWIVENGYHHDHKSIRHISETSFAMEFLLYKGHDTVVNTFDFIVNYDGSKFLDPHALAAMIFVGECPKL